MSEKSFIDRHYILNEQKDVVPAKDLMDWANFFEDFSSRMVKRTLFPERQAVISTVFLGIDHGFGMNGPPLVFESMCFEDGSMAETDCARYATWDVAIQGHEAMVQRYMAKVGGDVKRLEDVSEPNLDDQYL